ncbi:Ras suppressor protein 1 [Liparis tanakae]|uniref:Ras suppressor protein 1 n=1 Tax=Liparis tanakae TaxID=230148 RepID=A0A4Z2FP58_9TELE|nr:Ras suppressor protein 1 [Liparis tanakae]
MAHYRPQVVANMSKSLKKIVEESRDKNIPEVEMCDRGISNMLDVPGLCKRTGSVTAPNCLKVTLSNITQLVLSHNKLTGSSTSQLLQEKPNGCPLPLTLVRGEAVTPVGGGGVRLEAAVDGVILPGSDLRTTKRLYCERLASEAAFQRPPTIFLMASEMKMKEMRLEKPSSVKRVMYLMM